MIQLPSCRSIVILALLMANMIQGFTPDACNLISFKGLYLVLGTLNVSVPISDEGGSPVEVCGPSRIVETTHLCKPKKGDLATMAAPVNLGQGAVRVGFLPARHHILRWPHPHKRDQGLGVPAQLLNPLRPDRARAGDERLNVLAPQRHHRRCWLHRPFFSGSHADAAIHRETDRRCTSAASSTQPDYGEDRMFALKNRIGSYFWPLPHGYRRAIYRVCRPRLHGAAGTQGNGAQAVHRAKGDLRPRPEMRRRLADGRPVRQGRDRALDDPELSDRVPRGRFQQLLQVHGGA